MFKNGDKVRVHLDYETEVTSVHGLASCTVRAPGIQPGKFIYGVPVDFLTPVIVPEPGDIWETSAGVSYVMIQRSSGVLVQRIDRAESTLGVKLRTPDEFLRQYPGAHLAYRKGNQV